APGARGAPVRGVSRRGRGRGAPGAHVERDLACTLTAPTSDRSSLGEDTRRTAQRAWRSSVRIARRETARRRTGRCSRRPGPAAPPRARLTGVAGAGRTLRNPHAAARNGKIRVGPVRAPRGEIQNLPFTLERDVVARLDAARTRLGF